MEIKGKIYADRPDKDAVKITFLGDFYLNSKLGIRYDPTPKWKFWMPKYEITIFKRPIPKNKPHLISAIKLPVTDLERDLPL